MNNDFDKLMEVIKTIDPAMGNVLEKFMHSKCVGEGNVGSNGTTECNEVMMMGNIGEHVCFNHFPKPDVSDGFGSMIYQAASDKSNGVPAPKKKKTKRNREIWSGVNGKRTGGIV